MFLFFDVIFPVDSIDLASNSTSTTIFKDFTPFLSRNETAVELVGFVLIYFFATIICIILFPGRSIIEVFLIFALVIPRERSYWGVVFDEAKKTPLPFAVINVEKKYSNNEFKTIMQSVADLDGRYRVSLENTSGEIRIIVKYDGYESFSRTILLDPLASKSAFIADIPLKKLDSQRAKFNSLLYRLNVQWNSKLILGLFILSVLALFFTITEIGKVPTFFTIFQFFLYIPPVIWNAIIIYKRFTPRIGKIINSATGEGINGAIVKIYGMNRQPIAASAVTNSYGVANFNLDEGDYLINISKPGYKYSEESKSSEDLVEVHITSRGYLSENISLTPKDSIYAVGKDSLALINPFQ